MSLVGGRRLQALTCNSADARLPPAGLASSVRSQAVANDVNISWGVPVFLLTKQQKTHIAVPLCLSKQQQGRFERGWETPLICLLAQELLQDFSISLPVRSVQHRDFPNLPIQLLPWFGGWCNSRQLCQES